VATDRLACPVCGSNTVERPPIRSPFSRIDFDFRYCNSCGLTYVTNPRCDFAALYDAAYYAGNGADSFVDYLSEMDNPNTIREYEWRGIVRAVVTLAGRRDVRWLDFGCGLGGLVRHARANGMEVEGYDDGFSADWMRREGLPVLSHEDLRTRNAHYDVITAIEVVEHLTDPVAAMEQIARLLKPGGLFFLTTGNAEPHRDRFERWKYVHPDVHVTYFEPRTLACLYERAGLEVVRAGFVSGLDDIIRYKVLKTIGVRNRNRFERLVPWQLASRLVDRRHKVSAQPYARKPRSAELRTSS
jgi:SAM-dependent methyltransferase